ncbi:MAG: DUF1573 domain-containing protein [Chlorobi bacterium]|nr:DUF1573 domain-containing protein [Chlorobiota bacterium]
MKKISIGLFTILFFWVASINAQQKNAKIEFKSKTNNFGTIHEEKGPVSFTFEFTNSGQKPLIITNVKPSCGCTTSDYTKKPVPPGGSGYVTATYNPHNRPGKFNKSINITTNSDNPITVLHITGVVIPKPKSQEDIYPKLLSKIRLDKDHVGFTRILNTEVKTEEINFVNVSNELVKLDFELIPVYVTINVIPETIKPNEKGKIIIKYDAGKVNDFGFKINKVIIKENGVVNNKNRITISANIYEDFSKLTPEQLANAPIVTFDKRSFKFGTIKQGESVSTTFQISNTGKSDLVIRKTKASCGCTVVQPAKKVIKPGESTDIKATFNSRGKRGKQSKNITITTNDPKNPVSILKVTGVVEVPAK